MARFVLKIHQFTENNLGKRQWARLFSAALHWHRMPATGALILLFLSAFTCWPSMRRGVKQVRNGVATQLGSLTTNLGEKT
jgi:hypothetical protein